MSLKVRASGVSHLPMTFKQTTHFAVLLSLLESTPQNDQLMSERRVLGFKPALRLEWRDQDGQYET
jgi:hypothetical protein